MIGSYSPLQRLQRAARACFVLEWALLSLLSSAWAFQLSALPRTSPSSTVMLSARLGRPFLRPLLPLFHPLRRPGVATYAAATTGTATAAKKGRGRPPSSSGSASSTAAAGKDEVLVGGKLIIVESATKAKTIRKYLPDGWDVDYCMGHVRELPRSMSDIPKESREKFKVLGVKVDQEFEPVWVVLPGKEQLINRLKLKTKSCSELYLATDEDREGEAISWHLLELLKPSVPTQRVVFHEITPSAVKAGLEAPREIDWNLVEAQHARRILDRVAGYTMSPLLWKKITTRLSAGRVQSAGLKLLVDRERERMLFKSAPYAGLKAALRGMSWLGDLDARLLAINGMRVAIGTDFDPTTGELAQKRVGQVTWLKQEQMDEVRERLETEGTEWVVTDVESKMVSRKRPMPFTTSTLQQDANSRLGLTSAQTMKVAQELYEEGFISYMRTDSPNMGSDALRVAQKQALELYGQNDALASSEKKNTASVSAQEAHEAIRPSIVNDRFVPPRDTGITDKKKLNLYQLIYERSLASVMKDAKLERKIVAVQATAPDGGEPLVADFQLTGQTVIVHGFLRALKDLPQESEDGDGDGLQSDALQDGLKNLKPGQKMTCTSLKTLARNTSPPYRFTQGSFVRMVEELGIGRPSTYSSIIEVLKQRGYFTMRNGQQMVPTLVGFVVIQLLERHFPDFVDANFTSKMEATLDAIAKGSVDKGRYLSEYFEGLTSAIDLVTDTIDRNFAKRVVLSSVGNAPCAIFIGPFGPYVRDLMPGEPTDAELLLDDNAAKAYYQELWSRNDADFTKVASKVRATQLHAEMVNDPAGITGESLLNLLDATVNGKIIGNDPETGYQLVLKTASRYGKAIELRDLSKTPPEDPIVKRVQVPPTLEVSGLSVDTALELLHTFPRALGKHPEMGHDMVVNMAYYPNLRVGNFSYNLLNLTIPEILNFNADDAIRTVKESKATYYLGDLQGAGMWFVPKGRYSFPHVRWNQMKVYVTDNMLGEDGRPSTETAVALLLSRGVGGKVAAKKAKAALKSGTDLKSTESKKRTPSAYNLYVKEARAQLPTGMTFAQQSAQLAAQWKALPPDSEEKQRYAAMAETLKKEAVSTTGEQPRRKRASKAVGASEGKKRKGTAYLFFCSEKRPGLPPGLTAAAQMKELAALWRQLSEEERTEVEERFRASVGAENGAA